MDYDGSMGVPITFLGQYNPNQFEIIWTNDRELIKYGLITGKYLALDTQALEGILKGKDISKHCYKVFLFFNPIL